MPRLTERARQVLTEERRTQILDAAVQVFSDEGYHGATIRQIALRAGLAEGTIYLYFTSKRNLLLATWEHVAVSSLVPMLDRAASLKRDEDFLAAMLANRFELIRRHAPLVRLVLQQADVDRALRRALQDRIQSMRALVGEHIRRRIAAGRFRRVPVPIVLRAVAGMMIGIALLDAYDPDPLFRRHTTGGVAKEVARLLLHGLLHNEHRGTSAQRKGAERS
jgi:AcrR family transcriptional regulator